MVSLGDIGVLSGEELVLRYGAKTEQHLVDLIVAALKRGDEDAAKAVELRLNEVRVANSRARYRGQMPPAGNTDLS